MLLRTLALIAVCWLGALAVAADGDAPPRYVADFEGLDGIPAGWSAAGAVTIDQKLGFNSARSLHIARTQEAVETPTSVTLAPFPARDGIYELQADAMPALNSPDSSFNLTIHLDALDAKGGTLKAVEFCVVTTGKGWSHHQRQAELPAGTTQARYRLVLNKTFGQVRVDNLVAAFLAPAPDSVFTAIKLGPKAYGGMFYPGDPIVFNVTVECDQPWPGEAHALGIRITDYWGAEMTGPITVPLSGGDGKFVGVLDLGKIAFEPGKYYEVHAAAQAGAGDIAREQSSFAILPRPVTKDYRPHEIPFTLNNWDDRMKDTFFMADRMGIRWKLVWSGWEAKPPYKPYAPGIEWIKECDMGALLGVRPIANIEKRSGDWKEWTDESLRQGAYNMVMAYKDYVPVMIRCGNEPHTEPELVAGSVKAYQAVYEGVKKADPNVFFIGTSIGPHEEFFKNGFDKYLDAFDYHTYGDWKGLRTLDDGYKEMFTKHGIAPKPIVCTEIGLNSQGMARIDVTRDMIKKFAIHFAEGHQNLAWFDLLYPDPKGTIAGSNAEAFNVFNAKYALFAPKITAVSYYNLVNGICIKKFVQERIYDGEVEAVLFRDAKDRCLLVLWKEAAGRADAFLPLPGVGAVEMIRIDGSKQRLDAAGTGLTLTMNEDPLLLSFDSADLALAETLGKPRIALIGALPTIVKGNSVDLGFALEGAAAEGLQVAVPFGWKAEPIPAASGRAGFRITAPDRTTATVGRCLLRAADGSAELALGLPVTGRIALTVHPQPFAGAAGAGVHLRIRNNGVGDETVRYSIAMPEVLLMENGTFHKAKAQVFAADFAAAPEGEVKVAPGSEVSVVVPVKNLDPKSIYRTKVVTVDADGERSEVERFLSGFVGVPRLAAPLSGDPLRDAAAWEHARTLTINERKQYYQLRGSEPTAAWDGEGDLSGSIRFLWDDDHLYLRADVTDDAYHHAQVNGQLWSMDGLQLLVDPNRDSAAKSGYYDIAMGQGKNGDQAWCHSTAHPSVLGGRAKGIELTTVVTDGSHRIQVAKIPWAHLAPFTPRIGGNLGLAVIFNEDDGPGRYAFMGWFGCAHSKQLDLVGDLVLTR